MLAIIKNNPILNRLEIVGTAQEGWWAELPDGSRVSPAEDGYNSRGYELREIQEADPVPAGFSVTGRAAIMVDGNPKWVYDLTPSTPYVPDLTSRQFWLAALDLGIKKDALIEELAEHYEGDELEALQIEVKESANFKRDYALVSEIANLKGITDAELDDLWTWASNI